VFASRAREMLSSPGMHVVAFDRTIGATADRIRALQAREAATSTKGNRRD
jgi:hypothetical protein